MVVPASANLPVFHSMLSGSATASLSPAMLRPVSAINGAILTSKSAAPATPPIELRRRDRKCPQCLDEISRVCSLRLVGSRDSLCLHLSNRDVKICSGRTSKKKVESATNLHVRASKGSAATALTTGQIG